MKNSPPDKGPLTFRQYEVMCLVIKGLSNREVATQLGITIKTVKFHLWSVYKKYDVKGRTQLIVKILHPTEKAV